MFTSHFTGVVVETTLESCPWLTYISAKRILVTRITQGRPWICRALETFDVSIVVDTDIEAEISAQSCGVLNSWRDLPTWSLSMLVGLGHSKQYPGAGFSTGERTRPAGDTPALALPGDFRYYTAHVRGGY